MVTPMKFHGIFQAKQDDQYLNCGLPRLRKISDSATEEVASTRCIWTPAQSADKTFDYTMRHASTRPQLPIVPFRLVAR